MSELAEQYNAKNDQAVSCQVDPLVMSTDYKEVMRAEMSPDIYDGDNFDQVRPRWHCFADGDMDSEFFDDVELAAKDFPPGTRIIVLEPECPKCQQIPELCRGDDSCNFDWDGWIESKYA